MAVTRPESVSDIDEALAHMAAELDLAKLRGELVRVADIEKLIDQALTMRFALAPVQR